MAPWVDPVVLEDAPEDCPAVTEETFGPTVTLTQLRVAAEGWTGRTPRSAGLGSAVCARRGALQLARGLRAGMTSINVPLAVAFVPALPSGGVGESGSGRIHGADGQRESTRAKAITRQRFAHPMPVTSLARPPGTVGLLDRAIRLRHGGWRHS